METGRRGIENINKNADKKEGKEVPWYYLGKNPDGKASVDIHHFGGVEPGNKNQDISFFRSFLSDLNPTLQVARYFRLSLEG